MGCVLALYMPRSYVATQKRQLIKNRQLRQAIKDHEEATGRTFEEEEAAPGGAAGGRAKQEENLLDKAVRLGVDLSTLKMNACEVWTDDKMGRREREGLEWQKYAKMAAEGVKIPKDSSLGRSDLQVGHTPAGCMARSTATVLEHLQVLHIPCQTWCVCCQGASQQIADCCRDCARQTASGMLLGLSRHEHKICLAAVMQRRRTSPTTPTGHAAARRPAARAAAARPARQRGQAGA